MPGQGALTVNIVSCLGQIKVRSLCQIQSLITNDDSQLLSIDHGNVAFFVAKISSTLFSPLTTWTANEELDLGPLCQTIDRREGRSVLKETC